MLRGIVNVDTKMKDINVDRAQNISVEYLGWKESCNAALPLADSLEIWSLESYSQSKIFCFL